jgi:hypothetical protein
MSRRYAYSLMLVVVASACAPRYAIVHVVAKESGTQTPATLDVFSAKDGTFLGETPFDLFLENRRGRTYTLSMFAKRGCYVPVWQLVEIPRWAPSQAEARDAKYRNDVLLQPRREAGCNGE